MVKLLLAAGAKPDNANLVTGQTPCLVAAGQGHVGVIEALLKAHAQPDRAFCTTAQTPLQVRTRRCPLPFVFVDVAALRYSDTCAAVLRGVFNPHADRRHAVALFSCTSLLCLVKMRAMPRKRLTWRTAIL